jgi:uncharacterized protein YfdQ (DUF2303 family)
MSYDFESVINAAKRYADGQLVEIGAGVMALSLPEGRKVQSIKPLLDEYLEAPERKKGTAGMTTLTSFQAHVNRHKDADSVVFMDDNPKAPALLCVYDYNKAGPTGDPRFGQHRARYAFPVSDEWRAWTSTGTMSQEAFAHFIEDRLLDVMDPTLGGDSIKEFAVNLMIDLAPPRRLMELSRGLQIHVGQRVVNAMNLSTGEAQIQFVEEHKTEAGANLRLPGGFVVAIPVFRGGVRYQIGVRLRYRVTNGAITWAVEPYRTQRVFDDAIAEAVKATADATALPVIYGTPEA